MRPERYLEVAAAVLQKPDGTFLLARRPEGKPYAGYWEFPGGKIEAGEGTEEALCREIREELGVAVELAYPWITQLFKYPHATVKLYFYRVLRWQGEPHPHENQQLSWQLPQQVEVAPLLPANAPVLRALALPPVFGISQAAELGREVFLARLEGALQQGLRFVQVREKQLPLQELVQFAREVAALAHRHGARVVLNGEAAQARAAGVDGIHLSAGRLLQLDSRPPTGLCGASCHNQAELDHAARLGLDYAVLGPLAATRSHPGVAGMGWRAFAALIRGYPLPVYALGGLARDDLTPAWEHGAHGIAMLSGAWADGQFGAGAKN